MRFVIIRMADEDTEAGVPPSTELLDEMTKYNGELAEAGVPRAGEGLQPSSKGARVTFSKGRTTVVDGPFTESKELIAGFAMIEVASKEETIEWARRWPAADGNGASSWRFARSSRRTTSVTRSRRRPGRARNRRVHGSLTGARRRPGWSS